MYYIHPDTTLPLFAFLYHRARVVKRGIISTAALTLKEIMMSQAIQLVQAKAFLARQLELQAVIRGIPAKHMDMNEILANCDSKHHVEYLSGQKLPYILKHLCGCVGCIGGWADVYPPFVKQGICEPYGEAYSGDQLWNASVFFDMPKTVFASVYGFVAISGREHKRIALARIAAAIKDYKREWGL